MGITRAVHGIDGLSAGSAYTTTVAAAIGVNVVVGR